MSDSHAPTLPPLLCIAALSAAICDHEGSSGWYVNRITAMKSPTSTKTSHQASLTSLALTACDLVTSAARRAFTGVDFLKNKIVKPYIFIVNFNYSSIKLEFIIPRLS